MVNLEYVIKSDCKPTAISLFFRGQHSSIIPDPCPQAFSYNWHQILFWRRYLFSLAFRLQLASVWDLISQSHRFPSLNVISDRSPDPHHSCLPGSLVLALLVFHHLPVYRGLVKSMPEYGGPT